MNEKKVTLTENARGLRLVGETYWEFKKLAEEQIEKDDNITEEDLDKVIIGLLITKLLVAEGKLEEKFFESAIS
jgi:hypothetical protein